MPADGDDAAATRTALDSGTLDLAGDHGDASDPGPGRRGPLHTGSAVGRYELRRMIGEGGMGVVFEAWDPDLARTVAVKVLRMEDALVADPEQAQRLQREGRVMAQLSHPNVLPVFDVGITGGAVWVAMQHVKGGDLRAWLATPRAPEAIVAAFVQAARGLAAAHDAGFVHRDFKPSNVLVEGDRMLVSDFGLARTASTAGPAPVITADTPLADTVTRDGALVGTPAYMAPEQYDGGPVDHRADQFALCVALWEALYGERPFAGHSWRELAESTKSGKVVAPPERRERRVPPRLHGALRRGLQPDPDARWPSMHALIDALAPASRHRDRRLVALGAIGVAAAGVAAVAVVTTRDDARRASPCAALPERFNQVWGADARARVAASLARAQVAYAEQALTEIARQLDARARAWNEMRHASCEATLVHREQSDAAMDLRAACLDRKLADVAAFVTVLGEAAPATVRDASRRAASVGDVAECADAAALARRAPRPVDPEARAAVDALERDVALARERADAGGASALGDLAVGLVARARQVGYAPLLAESLAIRAAVEESTDRNADAARTLEEGVLAAEAGSDDRLRFELEIRLSRLLGIIVQDRAEEAGQHLERAAALLARLGDQPRDEAMVARVRGMLLWTNGRYAEALPHAERAVALHEQTDPGGVELARALHLVAIIHDALDTVELGIPPMERALEIAKRVLGPGHPSYANMLQTSSGLYRRVDRLDEAERDIRLGVEITERAFGPRSGEVGRALINLANLQRQRKDSQGAIASSRRAVELLTETMGPDHAWTTLAVHHLGADLSKAGEVDEALAMLERAATSHRATGNDGPPYADVQRSLAEHFLRHGRPADAIAPAREAVRIMTASQGEDAARAARPLATLGDALRAAGRPREARDAYQRGLTVVGDDPSNAKLRAELARALTELDAPR